MPRFAAFPGIRYAGDPLALVTAPPYDVIDDDERAALAAQHDHNVVRIDLPRGGEDPYADAGELFRQWQHDGVVRTDPASLYLYRMTFTDEAGARHETLGVIGALGIEPPGEGDVLPHEHTTPKAKSDRLQLLRSTAANLSAVWGLSLATGLSKLLDVDRSEPVDTWRDPDGVEHALWRVVHEDDLAAIAEAVSAAPVVIADGHHRYETCGQYRTERRDASGGASGAYDSTLCFVVELVDDQLTVQPIHRLVSGVADETQLTAALGRVFDVGALEPLPDATIVSRLVTAGALALVTAEGLRTLTPKPGAFSAVADLDSARLDHALAPLADHQLTYQHGVGNVVRAVTTGEALAGVLLRPVSVAEIRRTAHAREKMPPKSTFFWPKPRTGTVFRSLA